MNGQKCLHVSDEDTKGHLLAQVNKIFTTGISKGENMMVLSSWILQRFMGRSDLNIATEIMINLERSHSLLILGVGAMLQDVSESAPIKT